MSSWQMAHESRVRQQREPARARSPPRSRSRLPVIAAIAIAPPGGNARENAADPRPFRAARGLQCAAAREEQPMSTMTRNNAETSVTFSLAELAKLEEERLREEDGRRARAREKEARERREAEARRRAA